MKIVKMSLATIVTLGAMSTFASATPLEEVVKNADLNGFVRYRATRNSSDENIAQKYTVITDFTFKVDENLKANAQLSADGGQNSLNQSSNTSIRYELNRANFQYTDGGFFAKVGKQEVFTPWTDDGYKGTTGDGLFALYSVGGITFGGAAFTNTNVKVLGKDLGDRNLYGAALIGTFDPVALQLWTARLTNVFDYAFFGDLKFNFAGFKAQAQASMLNLNKGLGKAVGQNDDKGVYYGGTLGYDIKGFKLNLGYTQTDKDMGIYSLAGDSAAGYIFFGKQLSGETANKADTQVMFGEVGYTMDKFSLGAGYGQAKIGKNTNFNEWYAQFGYAYSKNFNLSAYYSTLGKDAKNEQARFEAKYSF